MIGQSTRDEIVVVGVERTHPDEEDVFADDPSRKDLSWRISVQCAEATKTPPSMVLVAASSRLGRSA